jgi:hypothetical protein
MVGAEESGLGAGRKRCPKSILTAGDGSADGGGISCSEEEDEAAAGFIAMRARSCGCAERCG